MNREVRTLQDNGAGALTLSRADIARLLPPRPRESHKGQNGRALLCAGSARYTGAALLASAAALRVGCGVLETAVPAAVKAAFSALPEACCTPVGAGGAWDASACREAARCIEGKQALGIGPGMGRMEDNGLLAAAVASGKPLVVDADGLNLLSRARDLLEALHPGVALTPHPGEMARLLGAPVAQILADPRKTAAEAAERWNCTVLLKGAVSVIAAPGRVVQNETGNPGLAKGGSGDVLAGLILGLLSQGLGAFDAACAGAYLLGVSADTALALLGSRMLMAGDVIGAVEQTIGAIR